MLERALIMGVAENSRELSGRGGSTGENWGTSSEYSHLRLEAMIWYNMPWQWRKPKSPAGGEVSADGEEKSSPLTLMTLSSDE